MRSFIAFAAIACALPLAACSGSARSDTGSTGDLKSQAAADLESGKATGDPCATNAWYGDGACDTFCPVSDTDCAPTGDPIVCATFLEVSDGKCSREPTDPCLSQDPDCGASTPPDPGDPVYCAAILEAANGECSRAPDDPCQFQDPDCVTVPPEPPGGYDCDASHIVCMTFAAVAPCPEGQAYSVVDGCYGKCVPLADCAPLPTEPLYDCDTTKITCQTFAPVICPDGTVPTVENGCYGPCVPSTQCLPTDPVACIMISETPDGVCSRTIDDPCRFQDPDCVQ